MAVLFSKLENMLHNSLYVNVLLTGLVAQLACYPQPLLRSFLLNANMVFQPSVKSLLQVPWGQPCRTALQGRGQLWVGGSGGVRPDTVPHTRQVLGSVKNKIESFAASQDDFPALLLKAKKYLIARGKLDWGDTPNAAPALRRSDTLGEPGWGGGLRVSVLIALDLGGEGGSPPWPGCVPCHATCMMARWCLYVHVCASERVHVSMSVYVYEVAAVCLHACLRVCARAALMCVHVHAWTWVRTCGSAGLGVAGARPHLTPPVPALPAVKSRKPSLGELLLRHTQSPTRARAAAQLALQQVREGPVLQALAGAGLFRGAAEKQGEALRVKNAVYCAVVFTEFLKELAAIAQAHAVTSPFLLEPPEE